MKRIQASTILLLLLLLLLSISQGRSQQPLGDPVFAPYRERVDVYVEAALTALAHEQLRTGYFNGRYGDETGTVGLVGMAYLAKGHVPGQGRYQHVINRCIDCILASATGRGLLTSPQRGSSVMYSHCISTLFLSEVSGMVDSARQVEINRKLPRALRLILDAQAVVKGARDRGGWRYQPDSTDSDLSVAGWAVMALRSAKSNGAPVPDRSVKEAIDYVKRCYSRGKFAYTAGSSGTSSLRGVGVLCLELFGLHGSEALNLVGDNILENPILTKPYSTYYEAQAMFQLGGKYWSGYAEKLYPFFLESARGAQLMSESRAVYERALIVLALSVPYRQLPIYQRDESASVPP